MRAVLLPSSARSFKVRPLPNFKLDVLAIRIGGINANDPHPRVDIGPRISQRAVENSAVSLTRRERNQRILNIGRTGNRRQHRNLRCGLVVHTHARHRGRNSCVHLCAGRHGCAPGQRAACAINERRLPRHYLPVRVRFRVADGSRSSESEIRARHECAADDHRRAAARRADN